MRATGSRGRAASRAVRGPLWCGVALAAAAFAPACSRADSSDGPADGGGSAEAPPAAGGFVEEARQRGIPFRMHFLPGEQGENFKINLYDHGSGVVVFDGDGDGDDDVYLLDQLGPNALYRNDGGRFTDVTEAAGVALAGRICVGAAAADADGDGDLDLVVTTTRAGNAYLRNEGGLRFTDATKEAGIEWVGHCEQPVFFDADADGDLDLLVTAAAEWTTNVRDPEGRYYEGLATLWELVDSKVERNRFYLNDGKGRFTDATSESGLGGGGWDGDSAVFDHDDDGDLDLFVVNMFGGSSLYRNDGGAKFTNVTKDVLGAVSWGAVGARAFDYDLDGRLDLYVVDMHSDMWTPAYLPPDVVRESAKYRGPEGRQVDLGWMKPEERETFRDRLKVPKSGMIFGNSLYRNLGGGKFEEVSDRARAETFWGWGIAAADYDQDGDEDVFVPTGMGYPYFYWRAPFLRNRGDGTFEDASAAVGLDPPPGGPNLGPVWKGRAATRSSRAAAVGDFDADGRPDLVVNNFNDRAHLFMNRFPEKRWVAFRLTGTKGHASAIGARVTVRAGGRTFLRQVQAAGGYLAQSTPTLFFGLGDAAEVEACEISWPGGRTQKLTAVATGKLHLVTEPRE